MPFLFIYLLKLSVSLAVIFLFYHFALRKLTFYNWNRWYLLGYSLLCFFIPFIDISPVLQNNEWTEANVLRWVPVIGDYKENIYIASSSPGLFTPVNTVLLVLLAGMLILLLRLFIQFISFRRIMKKAKFVSGEDIKLYEVDDNIIPFSFGNSIFINSKLHSETELQEIIRHEFVHVKQKHSIDIIWAEILCLLNWYNPFAWLLKASIRQNLEFIADNKVLGNGINKKEYQYLLLKVIGNNQFSIATPFNFSSLKKRIAMMNKMQSAKKHLLKFLFVLPFIAVMLVAFRGKINSNNLKTENTVTLTGIIYDAKTLAPIPNVNLSEINSGINVKTNDKGFYEFNLPIQLGVMKMKFKCSAENYQEREQLLSFKFTSFEKKAKMQLISLMNNSDKGRTDVILNTAVSSIEYFNGGPLYDVVFEKFMDRITGLKTENKVDQALKESNKPIIIVDGLAFAVDGKDNNAKVWFSKDEYSSLSEIKVAVDRKIMSIEKANETVDRKDVKGVAAIDKKTAKRFFGIDNIVLVLYITTEIDQSMFEMDTLPVPPTPPTPPAPVQLPDNIQKINVANGKATVTLKNGQKEDYDLSKPEQKEKFEKKYGGIIPPPPPKAISREYNDKISNVSSEFEISDKKAVIKLKNGIVEKYDLTNTKERTAFEKKYGKIVNVATTVNSNANVNANVNADVRANVNANVNTTIKAVVAPQPISASPVTTISPKVPLNSTSATSVTPAALVTNLSGTKALASTAPRPASLVSVIDDYGYIITGKEDIIITITKNTTRQELEAFKKQMKEKGVALDFDEIEYNDKGVLISINGTMKSGVSNSNFVANDFEKLILAMIKKGDRTYFKVSTKDNKEVI